MVWDLFLQSRHDALFGWTDPYELRVLKVDGVSSFEFNRQQTAFLG